MIFKKNWLSVYDSFDQKINSKIVGIIPRTEKGSRLTNSCDFGMSLFGSSTPLQILLLAHFSSISIISPKSRTADATDWEDLDPLPAQNLSFKRSRLLVVRSHSRFFSGNAKTDMAPSKPASKMVMALVAFASKLCPCDVVVEHGSGSVYSICK
jgi:hypothetical protein